ncbi:Superkiller viralicidic activity 2-like 2 [Histomonas meleagridis]|uniref:Superkiller viralicidic activity 2-like 2 n=1 Tax=Histomonas meleagridis TaxID=135588 RepID=UPI00355AA25C|nr:Superkiller viralicidic activity 2-like 2 [Histomonas meleagridis]KAH0797128.1 Superkiller viralicidic activity 2-like 2 [Histomonas meleagridis]
MFQPLPDELIDYTPNVNTIQFESDGDNVLHFAALPDGTASIENPEFPEELAFNYGFELDEFQKCAVSCVHKNESVLVSAHTSAGKTAIAQYAIALALKNNSRVVYTSPIKALSNQKYQDLLNDFHDVGLMTGDVTINPSASCLVMTTEILRMMLFSGDELINTLSWVIYDEVHYMKDPARGVVWEESIILLPDKIRFVFLSATIPNAREFSEWIADLHKQTCHVVYTEHRPVPLQYFISPLGSPKLYLVRNSDGDIVDNAFEIATSQVSINGPTTTLHGAPVKSLSGPQKSKPSKKFIHAHTCQVVTQMMESQLYPLIVFVFSRRDCNKIHEAFNGRSFNREEEKAQVNLIFENALYKLDECDRGLPQIQTTLQLALRGIGVHHGGLMPLMKEIVEILFGQGLIKVLFATETFSMGLNMPAKSVIFNDLYKFDGNERRLIYSGEFIQMSGRAGRRNRDKFGAVAINYTGETAPPELRALMTSSAQPLNSEFRVTYNMLLNLMITSFLSPKELMRKSFHQFQMIRELPKLISKRDEMLEAADAIMLTNAELTEKAVKLEDEINVLEQNMRRIETDYSNIKPLIQPGRILKVKSFGWGVIASAPQKKNDDMIIITYAEETGDHRIVPSSLATFRKPYLIKIPIQDIEQVSTYQLEISFDSISNEFLARVMRSVNKLEKEGILVYEPLQYIKIEKEEYEQNKKQYDRLTNTLQTLGEIDINAINKYKIKRSYIEESDRLTAKIESMRHLVNQNDLEAMRSVLIRLDFIDNEGNVTLKGRVASTINSANEIILTELLLNGFFNELTPQYIAAILTTFVCDNVNENNSDSTLELPDKIIPYWKQLQKVIQNTATISLECGVDIDVEKFKREFNTSFINIALDWVNGISFSDLMKSNENEFEGSIIRTMKRLDELINQMAKASTILNNNQHTEQEKKFLDASNLIKRGIISTASLYL